MKTNLDKAEKFCVGHKNLCPLGMANTSRYIRVTISWEILRRNNLIFAVLSGKKKLG